MLSACSTYFDAIFSQHEENNPIVILKDVRFADIKALVEFMYKGEINVDNVSLTFNLSYNYLIFHLVITTFLGIGGLIAFAPSTFVFTRDILL